LLSLHTDLKEEEEEYVGMRKGNKKKKEREKGREGGRGGEVDEKKRQETGKPSRRVSLLEE